MIDTVTLEGTFGGSGDGRAAARYLVLALDGQAPHVQPERYLLAGKITSVDVGRGVARASQVDKPRGTLRIDIPDRRVSRLHVVLRWKRGRWFAEDQGSKNGTRINGVRGQTVELRDGDVIELGCTFFVYRDVQVTDAQLVGLSQQQEREPAAFNTLCVPLENQFSVLRRVASADVAVMISGETGTGKELVASAVHELSGRPGAFVAVNCGAIARTLVESELFGHVKGAFSGAGQDKPGLVRASDRGTLFLDEVAELPEPAQVALLRVLQEREVRSVGSTHPTKVDLRVVTATHRDLAACVEQGTFRADLYSRLAGFSVTVPPLRERREDLGLLLSSLLMRLTPARAAGLRIHAAAVRALFDHAWPMNVRELEQALRVALAVAEDDELGVAHLPQTLHRSAAESGSPSAPADGASAEPEGDREQRLVLLLTKHKGNLSAIARELSTSRSQVRRLAERYGLDPESYR